MAPRQRGTELSAEEVDSLLQDFDRQVQKRRADRDKAAETFAQQMRSLGKMFLLKLPRADRELKATEILIMCDALVNPGEQQQPIDLDDNVVQTVDEQIERVKKEVRSSVKKQQQSSRKARQANKDESLMMPPPSATASSSVRRSARKRVAPNDYDMMTPLGAYGKMGRGNASVRATPMITPKFDMSRPLPRSVMRLAKPTEMLVSMSGSPVYIGPSGAPGGSSTVKMSRKRGGNEETLQISLGKGRTMMLPVHGGDSSEMLEDLELDDLDREKLIAIRSTLDSLLK